MTDRNVYKAVNRGKPTREEVEKRRGRKLTDAQWRSLYGRRFDPPVAKQREPETA
jgi:hypothetical protein